MRWRKAHRNARRVAKTVRIPHSYFMRYLDITEEAWEEWLRKLLPTMLNENSVMARILMRKPEPTLTRRTQLPRLSPVPFRGMPYYVEPDPRTSGVFQGKSRYFMVLDDIDDEPLNRRGRRMFWGDTFMVMIPDPLGLRDDSRRRT